MERTPGNIRVVDQADPAVAAQLSQEIGAFNMAAVGLHDGREPFAVVRAERGALVGGVDGWT